MAAASRMYHPAGLRIVRFLRDPVYAVQRIESVVAHLEPLDGRLQRVQAALHTPLAVQYVQCAATRRAVQGRYFDMSICSMV